MEKQARSRTKSARCMFRSAVARCRNILSGSLRFSIQRVRQSVPMQSVQQRVRLPVLVADTLNRECHKETLGSKRIASTANEARRVSRAEYEDTGPRIKWSEQAREREASGL